MTKFGIAFAGLLFSLGAVPVHGGVLVTAPAHAGLPSHQTMFCDIVNLNTAPANVQVEIMDYSGYVVNSFGDGVTLQPNQAIALADTSGQGGWCRFTVDGSARKYRATAMYHNGTNYTVSMPAY